MSQKRLKIGLTGGIGSGKSTVAKVIECFGFPVFYSDVESKRILFSDKSLHEIIKNEIGPECFVSGRLNKEKLAGIVFNDKRKLEILNKLLHPRVRKAFDDWCNKQTTSLCFNEAAIIFETGASSRFDATILVTANLNERIERVSLRDSISKQGVESRMNKQWPDFKKKMMANYVVENNRTSEIIPQIHQILNSLTL